MFKIKKIKNNDNDDAMKENCHSFVEQRKVVLTVANNTP